MLKIKLPSNVKTILSVLHNAGYDAYVVGGCVRDSIMGKTPDDWDICTDATPDQMLDLFDKNCYKTIPTGIKHGTITVMLNGIGYECTTYRIDGNYSDRRRPDNVTFTDNLIKDLKRRDFTINAMAYNEEKGLIDPFNGKTDIQHRIIRCVGNAKDRFSEDALRIMRALRFSVRFKFRLHPDTHRQMHLLADNLNNIAIERINTEFCKIIAEQSAPPVLLNSTRIISRFIPEIMDAVDFDQNNPYHQYPVFDHIMKALSRCKSNDIITRLAVLFHDIGKPHCYQDGDDGYRHFKGHGNVSAEITEKIMHRMRFDNDTISKTVELVKYHDATFEVNKKCIRRWLNRIGEEQFRRLLDVRVADIKGQKDDYDIERINKVDNIRKLLDEILAENACFALKDLAVNGKDLIEIGYKPGPELGKILNELLNRVIDENLSNDKQILIAFAKNAISD